MWAKAELWNFESYLEENHSSVTATIADSCAVFDIGRGSSIKAAAKENNLGSRVLNSLKKGDCSMNRKKFSVVRSPGLGQQSYCRF